MSAQNEIGYKTFTSGEALAKFRRVKLDTDGEVVYADAADGNDWIGVTQHATSASGELVVIRLRNTPGTYFLTAANTVDVGDQLFPANDGKVSGDASGTTVQLVSVEAATLDSIFEAAPGGKASV